MQRVRGREGSGEAGKWREKAQRKEVQGIAGRQEGESTLKQKVGFGGGRRKQQ